MLYRAIVVVVAVFMGNELTHAQSLIAYDPFNQNLGQLNGISGTGGVWPVVTTWQPLFGNGGVVSSGSLGYGPLATLGNQAQFSWFAGNNASFRSLGSNRGGAPADFWLSFTANFGQNGQGLYLYSGTQQVMRIGSPSVGTGGGLGMELSSSVTNGATQILDVSPSITANGATHFFAAHFQLGAGTTTNTITLFVDPDFNSLSNGTAPTGGSSVSYGTALNFQFDRLVIGNFSGVTGTNGVFALDEIRLGSSWITVSAVPEPATIALSAVALGAGLYLWRRKVRQIRTASNRIIEVDIVSE